MKIDRQIQAEQFARYLEFISTPFTAALTPDEARQLALFECSFRKNSFAGRPFSLHYRKDAALSLKAAASRETDPEKALELLRQAEELSGPSAARISDTFRRRKLRETWNARDLLKTPIARETERGLAYRRQLEAFDFSPVHLDHGRAFRQVDAVLAALKLTAARCASAANDNFPESPADLAETFGFDFEQTCRDHSLEIPKVPDFVEKLRSNSSKVQTASERIHERQTAAPSNPEGVKLSENSLASEPPRLAANSESAALPTAVGELSGYTPPSASEGAE